MTRDDTGAISIVIPHRNHSDQIGTQFDALHRCGKLIGEILIIDDASTQTQRSDLERITDPHTRARVVHLPTQVGAVAATNYGLSRVREQYVMTLAADDQIYPGYVSAAVRGLASAPTSAFVCGRVIQKGVGTAKGRLKPLLMPPGVPGPVDPALAERQFRVADNFLYTGVTIFRTEPLEQHGYFAPALGPAADGVLLRQLAFRYGYFYLKSPGATWNINDAGMSRSLLREREALSQVIAAATEVLRADPWVPHWYPDLYRRRQMFVADVLRTKPALGSGLGSIKSSAQLLSAFRRHQPYRASALLLSCVRARKPAHLRLGREFQLEVDVEDDGRHG